MMFVWLSGRGGWGRGGRGGGRVCDHAVSQMLEIVGGWQAPEGELFAAEKKRRRPVDLKAITLLAAEFDARGVLAARHAGVVLRAVQSRGLGKIVEQARGIPPRLRPTVIVE